MGERRSHAVELVHPEIGWSDHDPLRGSALAGVLPPVNGTHCSVIPEVVGLWENIFHLSEGINSVYSVVA